MSDKQSTKHSKRNSKVKTKDSANNGTLKSNKKIVNIENQIKNNNKDAEDEIVVWHKGVCKWFNKTKGWGFINLKLDEGGGEEDGLDADIFVYQASIAKAGFRCLLPGEEVECQVVRRDKGWEAVKVKAVTGAGVVNSVNRRQKKVRCFNCGNIARHLATDCPHPPLPKRCHQCKVKILYGSIQYQSMF